MTRRGLLRAIVALVIAALVATCETPPTSSPVLTEAATAGIASHAPSAEPPIPVEVEARIPVPGYFGQAVVAGDAIWIVTDVSGIGHLVRLDIETNATRELPEPIDYWVARADDGTLWTSQATISGHGSIVRTTLSRVDLETGAMTAVDLPDTPPYTRAQLAFGLGSIWMSISSSGPPYDEAASALWRVDPTSGAVLGAWPIHMGTIAVACGAVWGDSGGTGPDGTLKRFDPETGVVSRFGGGGPLFERPDGCWHWVSTGIERVSPAPSVTTVTSWRGNLLFDGRDFWNWPSQYLQRWDPATGLNTGARWIVDPESATGGSTHGPRPSILAARGSMWLVNSGGLVIRFVLPGD
jgi:hypothetical protein